MAFVRWRGNCAELLATVYENGRSRQILLANLPVQWSDGLLFYAELALRLRPNGERRRPAPYRTPARKSPVRSRLHQMAPCRVHRRTPNRPIGRRRRRFR